MNFEEWLTDNNITKHGKTAIETIMNPTYENLENIIGKQFWICDYRLNRERDNKPLRNVPPKLVQVFSNDDLPKNKNVYYSPIHFREVKNGKALAQVIAPYDNTGYRSYPGISVNIFDDKKECYNFFRLQCIEAITAYQGELKRRTEEIKNKITEIQKIQDEYI